VVGNALCRVRCLAVFTAADMQRRRRPLGDLDRELLTARGPIDHRGCAKLER
jgi:hypothetical protein